MGKKFFFILIFFLKSADFVIFVYIFSVRTSERTSGRGGGKGEKKSNRKFDVAIFFFNAFPFVFLSDSYLNIFEFAQICNNHRAIFFFLWIITHSSLFLFSSSFHHSRLFPVEFNRLY